MFRKINLFEKILLPVGIALTFFGFYFIFLASKTTTTDAWLKLNVIFSWLSMLFLVVVAATTEDMKEELGSIQKEHITEIKLLREIVHENINELKLLRKNK